MGCLFLSTYQPRNLIFIFIFLLSIFEERVLELRSPGMDGCVCVCVCVRVCTCLSTIGARYKYITMRLSPSHPPTLFLLHKGDENYHRWFEIFRILPSPPAI